MRRPREPRQLKIMSALGARIGLDVVISLAGSVVLLMEL
jgi:hypothetical protein